MHTMESALRTRDAPQEQEQDQEPHVDVNVPTPTLQQQQKHIPDVVIHEGNVRCLRQGIIAASSTSAHDSSAPDSSEQSDDQDANIQALKAKVEMLEAQDVGLQGQIEVLKKNDDFQLRTCQESSKSLASQQTIIDK
ncbi:hypothetical protein L1987_48459 [Smallanthus sonchifolius]|uniref:Uncharacterized protein n=1 Tax=Smallanthus sonchifolius TaxID=185202 RepID=A0ACB9FSW9_9ASTR|nr:hypothetical protein L1987_48459 [Smallanthus sonchifolius]